MFQQVYNLSDERTQRKQKDRMSFVSLLPGLTHRTYSPCRNTIRSRYMYDHADRSPRAVAGQVLPRLSLLSENVC